MDLGDGTAPPALEAAGLVVGETPPVERLPTVGALDELDTHLGAKLGDAARLEQFLHCELTTRLQFSSGNLDPDPGLDSRNRRLDHEAMADLGPEELPWAG